MSPESLALIALAEETVARSRRLRRELVEIRGQFLEQKRRRKAAEAFGPWASAWPIRQER